MRLFACATCGSSAILRLRVPFHLGGGLGGRGGRGGGREEVGGGREEVGGGGREEVG